MADSSFAAGLAEAQPRKFVVLAGYPTDEESAWHVNQAITLGGGGTNTRRAVVLQAADASEEWIAAIISKTEEGWSTQDLTAFQGDATPQLGQLEGRGEDIPPEQVSVIRITDSKPT